MPNYVDVISNCFPDAEIVIRAGKDPEVYGDIEWITTPIDQATLDASSCAVNPLTYNINEVSFEDAFGQVLVEEFSKSSNASNVWLSHNGQPSDANPSIIPFNGKVVGVSFSNDITGAGTDIEIYITEKGSQTPILVYTWEFRNGKKGFNNMVPQQAFPAGSKVSVYLRNAGKSPRNADVSVYLQVLSADPEIHIEND